MNKREMRRALALYVSNLIYQDELYGLSEEFPDFDFGEEAERLANELLKRGKNASEETKRRLTDQFGTAFYMGE